MFCNRNHYNKAVQGARWDWFFFFFFFLICKMIIIFLCVFVLTAWCAFTYVLLLYVLYVVTECNRKIDIWNLDSRINSRMEPEVYNNMMKCIINALSPKRVSDPAYGKDWLIDWYTTKFLLKQFVIIPKMSSHVMYSSHGSCTHVKRLVYHCIIY